MKAGVLTALAAGVGVSGWTVAGFTGDIVTMTVGATSTVLAGLGVYRMVKASARRRSLGVIAAVVVMLGIPYTLRIGFWHFRTRVLAQRSMYMLLVDRAAADLGAPGTTDLTGPGTGDWGLVRANRDPNGQLIVWFHSRWGRRGAVFFSGNKKPGPELAGDLRLVEVAEHWYAF